MPVVLHTGTHTLVKKPQGKIRDDKVHIRRFRRQGKDLTESSASTEVHVIAIRLKPCLGPWRSLRGARQEVLRTDLVLPQRQRDPLYKHIYDDLPPSRTSDLIMSTLPDRAHLYSCQRSAGPPGFSVSYSPYTEDALDRWCRDHESR